MTEFNFLASLPSVAPEIGLTILGAVVLLLISYLPKEQARNIAYVSALGMGVIALTPFIWFAPVESTLMWGGMIRFDIFSQIFKVMILLAGAITSLMALDDAGVGPRPEFHLVIIVATLGGTLMASAADLVMLFIALETLSIPLYVLAAFSHRDGRSSESGLKYFLFGSFASAILLYGLSLLYGFAGTTSLDGIAAVLRDGVPLLPVVSSLLMVLVGFGFKISAVPFHFWTPDVYEGAPTPVTAFISVASKAASFALLVRFLSSVFPVGLEIDGQAVHNFWTVTFAVLAVLSMTLGNVMALRQTNIKRLLAYSSIAQAGYTLMGVAALQATTTIGQELAVASVAFYMFMYTFTNLLMFTGVVLVSESIGSEKISDYAGLQRRNPWLALALTVGLLSLGGIPPAAGFFGKLFLFQAAVEAGLVLLAIIGVLNAIVALYYYLVVIKVMYVDHHPDEEKTFGISRSYSWALGLTSVIVILLGTIAVTPVIDWARSSAAAITQAAQAILATGL